MQPAIRPSATPAWWREHDPINPGYLASNYPCRAACPVGTNAGGYVALIGQGRFAEAYALARGPNPLASVCGRICAHPCEAACRRGSIDAPIHIRALKRVVNERQGVESGASFESILKVVDKPRPRTDNPGRVAVVGAGPAGLACAHDLRLMGHDVVLFDAAPVGGGMLRLGIPKWRLPREVLEREIEFVRWLGVEIRYGVEIGKDIPFAELRRDYQAIFLGVGCRRGRGLAIAGAGLDGVITAIDLLVQVNLGLPVEIGHRVVVVGGGSVAMDVARSARRFGGTSLQSEEHHNLALDAALVAANVLGRDVTVVALESREEMPADPREVEEGSEEGIRLVNRRGPKEIVGDAGKVHALRTLDVARVFDERGRFAPQMIPGSERELACDTVVLAVGQLADLTFLGTNHGIAATPNNLVIVDKQTLATSLPGVWAGGDVAFGPRIAISAVADGRRAARDIDTFLTGRHDEPTRLRIQAFDTFGYSHPFARGDYEHAPRHVLPVIPIERRRPGAEVERVLDEKDAREEGARCLHCWVNTVFDSSLMGGSECIQCGGCVDVCPQQCIDLISLRRVTVAGESPLRLPDGSHLFSQGEPGAAMIKDETACIRCGLCARRCPVGCITMQALYRDSEAPLARLAEVSL